MRKNTKNTNVIIDFNLVKIFKDIENHANKIATKCYTFRTREVNKSDGRYLDSPVENAFNYLMIVGRKKIKDLYWCNVNPKDIGLTDITLSNGTSDIYFIGKDGKSYLVLFNGAFHVGSTWSETKAKANKFNEVTSNLMDQYNITGGVIVVLHDAKWRRVKDGKGNVVPMDKIISLFDTPGVTKVFDCTSYSDSSFSYSAKRTSPGIEYCKVGLSTLTEMFAFVINELMGKDLLIDASMLEMAKADYYNYITIRDMQYRDRSAIKAVLSAKPKDICTKKAASNYFKSLDINPIQGFMAGGISNFESLWKYVAANGITFTANSKTNSSTPVSKIAAKRSSKKPGRI